jgi:formate dehydrogenase major subunit
MTQHTTGVQGIRGFTILQFLLGNVGKLGRGVNALRGEPNVQGACEMGVLNNYLPGHLDYPAKTEPTLAAWTKKQGNSWPRHSARKQPKASPSCSPSPP